MWNIYFSGEAVPCRIAFERGKERHFCFLAISVGTSGWVILAEELPLKPHYGVVRVAAPLAGCKVSIYLFYFIFTLHTHTHIYRKYSLVLIYICTSRLSNFLFLKKLVDAENI